LTSQDESVKYHVVRLPKKNKVIQLWLHDNAGHQTKTFFQHGFNIQRLNMCMCLKHLNTWHQQCYIHAIDSLNTWWSSVN